VSPVYYWLDDEAKIRVVRLSKKAKEAGEVIEVVGRIKEAA
jgi:hypothetical protein